MHPLIWILLGAGIVLASQALVVLTVLYRRPSWLFYGQYCEGDLELAVLRVEFDYLLHRALFPIRWTILTFRSIGPSMRYALGRLTALF